MNSNAISTDVPRVRKKRRFETGPPPGVTPVPAQPNLINAAVAKALQMVSNKANGVTVAAEPTEVCGEVVINECHNRGLMIRSSTHQSVFQQCGALVMTRGRYMPPDMVNPPSGERPLHLHITAKTQSAVDAAVAMLTGMMQTSFQSAASACERVPIHIAGCEGPQWQAWLIERISGPASSYLRHIEHQSGCRLQLQGSGTGQSLSEPLHVVLSAVDATPQATSRLVLARQLLTSLMSTISVELSQNQQTAAAAANVFACHPDRSVTGAADPSVTVANNARVSSIEPPLVYTGIAPPPNNMRNQTSQKINMDMISPREWLRKARGN